MEPTENQSGTSLRRTKRRPNRRSRRSGRRARAQRTRYAITQELTRTLSTSSSPSSTAPEPPSPRAFSPDCFASNVSSASTVSFDYEFPPIEDYINPEDFINYLELSTPELINIASENITEFLGEADNNDEEIIDSSHEQLCPADHISIGQSSEVTNYTELSNETLTNHNTTNSDPNPLPLAMIEWLIDAYYRYA